MSLVLSGCIYHDSDSPMHVGACQIGSGAFGEWFWYHYLLVCFTPGFAWAKADGPKIPSYAVFKIWSNFIDPMIGQSSDDSHRIARHACRRGGEMTVETDAHYEGPGDPRQTELGKLTWRAGTVNLFLELISLKSRRTFTVVKLARPTTLW
jgi:hypothetical protein